MDRQRVNLVQDDPSSRHPELMARVYHEREIRPHLRWLVCDLLAEVSDFVLQLF